MFGLLFPALACVGVGWRRSSIGGETRCRAALDVRSSISAKLFRGLFLRTECSGHVAGYGSHVSAFGVRSDNERLMRPASTAFEGSGVPDATPFRRSLLLPAATLLGWSGGCQGLQRIRGWTDEEDMLWGLPSRRLPAHGLAP